MNDKHYNNNQLRVIYIDSIDILNKLTSKSIDYTYKCKNKKATILSIIIDEICISLTVENITLASINDSQLTKKINSLPIEVNNTRCKSLYLAEDKGYINRKVLKNRYKIESINNWIKNNKRLTMRVEHNRRNIID